MNPTIGGFIEFVTNVLQPPSYFNATTSVYVTYAYNFASQWAAAELSSVPTVSGAWGMYAIAVYNLAADRLIVFAQDSPGAPVMANSGTPKNPSGLPYWAWLRQQYNVLAFSPGVVQSTSDEGTSTTLAVAEQFMRFGVADLENLKTPYGRTYLGIAQSWGTNWGLS